MLLGLRHGAGIKLATHPRNGVAESQPTRSALGRSLQVWQRPDTRARSQKGEGVSDGHCGGPSQPLPRHVAQHAAQCPEGLHTSEKGVKKKRKGRTRSATTWEQKGNRYRAPAHWRSVHRRLCSAGGGGGASRPADGLQAHSHSMVPGGLEVTSYTTRLTLRTAGKGTGAGGAGDGRTRRGRE